MERRRHKRIYVHLKASIKVDEQTFDGYIENISESGVGYLMSSPGRFKDDYLTNKNIELSLQIQPDKTIVLNCVAMWAKTGLSTSKIIGIGMNIIDPPLEYGGWLRTLSM
jgi:hypothetical protein